MLNGVTFSDIERNDYLTPDIFGNSSRSESPYDDDEIERLIHYLIKRKGFKKDLDLWLIPPIDVDFSSVKPHFKIDNKTYSTSSKVSEENIHVITQHDGHLEYGMVAYIVSRLTHRKCLIRVNEDTLIPLIFFLKSSGNYVFKSKTILKIVAFAYRRIEHVFFKHVDWIVTHGPMDYQKIKLALILELFRR